MLDCRIEKEKKTITILGYLKLKRENYHVGLPYIEKEKKTITILGYLKSKRENYHVGLPERKEG